MKLFLVRFWLYLFGNQFIEVKLCSSGAGLAGGPNLVLLNLRTCSLLVTFGLLHCHLFSSLCFLGKYAHTSKLIQHLNLFCIMYRYQHVLLVLNFIQRVMLVTVMHAVFGGLISPGLTKQSKSTMDHMPNRIHPARRGE